ncbi:MFS alpha-glucoside transporter-like protein [Westerdykella ornata]|uniref:MFS alpha-glucoside transporter-like protein n=1 Tax=Westerdykella ornata TaxID=318751 RepID=A0A6A6J802_WESOR|nr:MFS alpha-glucoside transporter-like protein [Westerdykella ornata]KAF2272710.1 MFS alpha-glucoside transporter-like protein [Westerdykella ornata]
MEERVHKEHHDDDFEQARQAADDEHRLTAVQAIRLHRNAVIWSVLLSTCIIMEGYDIVLMNSFFAQPAFSRKYGEYQADSGTYQITASWQNGLSNAVSVGTMVGAFANGWFSHKMGYRPVLLASLALLCAFVFISFFAPNLPVLLVGQFLCGLPWGVFATMAPAYASEICPLALRGYLTVYVNLTWALGQLVSAGVQSAFSDGSNQWSYRIPFAIQWAWPIPLFVILFFAPESPWYYVRTGDREMAEKMVARLSSPAQRHLAKQTVAMMVHTNELEKGLDENTSYLQCFKGIDLRRTEIACMAFAAQPFCGSSMAGTPTYFFVQAGLPTSLSFKMSIGGLGMASVGTIISWFLMSYIGRRTLYLWGLASLSAILFITGFISVGASDSPAGNYAQAGMMIGWLFVYYLTVGPICYAIIGEVSSTRLRNKSVCVSRIVYYIAQVICNVVNPYMLNPTAGDWKGKTGFFWGACALVFFVWTYFRLPETKGRTFEELDILFANRVPAREFAKYKVDAYAEGEGAIKVH